MRLRRIACLLLVVGMAGGSNFGWGRDAPTLDSGTPDLGNRRPAKTGRGGGSTPVHLRSALDIIPGGETINEAIPIATLPFAAAGETCAHYDDYDESCEYASTSPDVVYSFTPLSNMFLDIDLCGSSYDTKVFVMDADLNVLACNEDYYAPNDPCGTYVSRLKGAEVPGGQTIYIVIDGYGGACGEYEIAVTEFIPCELTCSGDIIEGEPTLSNNYVDSFNGGCNSPGSVPAIMSLQGDLNGELSFCGVSGYYGNSQSFRDTDWFAITLGPTGKVTWTLNAEQTIFAYVLELECPDPGVYGVAVGGPCATGGLIIVGDPGDHIGLWVAPPGYSPPLGMVGNEFNYEFTLSGLSPHQVVAVETVNWGTVKSRYRKLSSIR